MKKNTILKILIWLTLIILICMGIYIKSNPTISVLCYHNIATMDEKKLFPEESDWTITVDNFKEHLEYLKEHGYKTLTMDEFIEWKNGNKKLPYKCVLITFDDGFLSNYHYAFPLLKEYGMNATVFVVGNLIETSSEEKWTGNIKTYMTKEIIQNLENEYPNIEIYSHSYNLHYVGSVDQDISILENDIDTFNNFYKETKVYCYPNGLYSENMKQALKNKGYKIAFKYGPDYKKASRNDDDFEIPRLNVSHGMNANKLGLRMFMYK